MQFELNATNIYFGYLILENNNEMKNTTHNMFDHIHNIWSTLKVIP